MTRSSTRIGAFVFVASLFAAACGGDALSEEEFVDQANEICADGSERLDALSADIEEELGGEEPTEEQIAEFAGDFADELRGQIEDLRNLEGPSDLEGELDSILDDGEQIADQLDEDPSSLTSDEDAFDDINSRFEALGLDECA